MNMQSIEPRERLRNHELNGLILTEFVQPPSLTVTKHAHECATILFTLEGFAADRIAGHVWECQPASLLIRPAGAPHSHHYGRVGAHCLVIEVKPSRLAAIRSFSSVLDSVGHFNDVRLAGLGLRIYTELHIMDSASELAIEGLVLEMMAQAVRQTRETITSGAQPFWLNIAQDLIHENYTQHLSLSEIAGVVGVHPAHLAEVFRKNFGLTIGQYIRRLRLDHATREVLLSDKPLAEISATAGFYDQSHFTKIFKRHTGMAPAKMRAAARISNAHTKTLRFSKLA
jgi:AraC family transcriptional regulator